MTISLKNQRVIYNDNGTLSDKSVELNDFKSGSHTFSYVTSQDYIYIGSEMPFNHKYLEVGSTVNAVTASLSVDIWYNQAWVAAVDIVDMTDVSGAPLAQSGIILWNTNRLKGWDRELDSEDVTGLTGTTIYNKYWIRLSYDQNLTSSVVLNHVGYKFANDDDLYGDYPELNNSSIKARFASGKTTWDEQHYISASEIIKDLKAMNVIRSADQLADYAVFERAAVHKCAEVIYRGMGPAQDDKRQKARAAYKSALDVKYFRVDANADGHLSESENRCESGWMSR